MDFDISLRKGAIQKLVRERLGVEITDEDVICSTDGTPATDAFGNTITVGEVGSVIDLEEFEFTVSEDNRILADGEPILASDDVEALVYVETTQRGGVGLLRDKDGAEAAVQNALVRAKS